MIKDICFILVFAISTLAFSQKTFVPDDYFEQELIYLGLDDVLDDSVLTVNIEEVTELIFVDNGIMDFTGIQDFSALTDLISISNPFPSIDLTENLNLTTIMLVEGGLSSLILGDNPYITKLICEGNHLNSIDLSAIISLNILAVGRNELEVLDLTNNVNLTVLDFSNNGIAEINLDENLELISVNCANNTIEELGVSHLLALESLICSHNNIVSLDLSNNSLLTDLVGFNNTLEVLNIKNGNNHTMEESNMMVQNNPNLYCIEVDDPAYAEEKFIMTDEGVEFSITECFSNIEVRSEEEIKIYPNPILEVLNIFVSEPSSFKLYDVFGNEVLSSILEKGNNKLDVKDFPSGIYFLSIPSTEGTSVKKIIIR